MNLIVWFSTGIIIGVYTASTSSTEHTGENVFVALAGALIGGFAISLLFGYSINGLNPAAVLSSVGGAIFALRYFRQITKAHRGDSQQNVGTLK